MTDTLPAKIGRYEIRNELGRGMMGVVYEAHDTLLDRTVALKTIHPAISPSGKDPKSFEERFLKEARAAARLGHPGIVVVYDVGTDPETGRLFLALEYLVGRTLEAMIAGGRPLEWRVALRITRRVTEALGHAHANGIIHRDIKPGNIMVLPTGEPKIMDFGIAKIETSHLTTMGKYLGSPAYMAPERAVGEHADARSDLFSLGAVLYELLTGQRAFGAGNIPAILLRITNEEPPPPSRVVGGLPGDLDDVLAHALAKAPADRYPSATAFGEDLEDVLEGRPPRHRRTGRPSGPRTLVTTPQEAFAGSGVPPRARDTARSGSGPSLSLPQDKRVCVAVMAGAQRGKIFGIEQPRILIGRSGGSANADIEIPDPEISRAHAVLECHGSRIVLRDVGSSNGTFVWEERIEERELEDRDEFRMGCTRLMLILADAK